MTPRSIVAAGALVLGPVFLSIYTILPAASPASAAESWAKAVKTGDVGALRDLLPEGVLDNMIVEAANQKLQPVYDAFARAERNGFTKWARRYAAMLVGGVELYRQTLQAVNNSARSRFVSLPDSQREQVAAPEGRRKWMASLAAEVLGPEHSRLAGNLEQFVEGQPTMQYILAEGWEGVKQAENLNDPEKPLYMADPGSQEFAARRRGGAPVGPGHFRPVSSAIGGTAAAVHGRGDRAGHCQ